MSENIVFVAAKRTPFGTFGGALKDHTATDLGVFAAQSALAQGGVKPESIDHVIFGNVIQSSADAAYLARHVGLRCGIPIEVPALTVNRLCGSGFEAIALAAQLLRLGEAKLVLAGGTENMSQAPYVLRGARFGYRMNHAPLEDSLVAGLYDTYPKIAMSGTAEKLAEQYGITRQQCDELAYRSQKAAQEATQKGLFKDEIGPLTLKHKGKEISFSQDEHIRPDASLEQMAKLKPVFKENGVVTAANASGICDGAAALILTTQSYCEKNGLKPLGKFLGSHVVGVDPMWMGVGPVEATKGLLKKLGKGLSDFKRFEVNEAFASQYLTVEKLLELPRERTNVEGGAIAIGHPLGASGARITAHLLHQLRALGGGKGLGTACIGGGQGIAVAVEAI